MSPVRSMFLLVVAACGAAVCTTPVAAAESSVVTIFRKTLAAYAECSSYQDQGVTETSFDTLSEFGPTQARFTTSFRRGAGLKFEYNPGELDHFSLWTDGKTAKTFFAPGGGKKTEFNDAADAMATAGMMSDGVGSLVASLVYNDEFKSRREIFKQFDVGLHGLKDLRRLEDATLRGKPCYRIAAKNGSSRCVYWVDQATFLIRRIEETLESPVFEGEMRRVVTFEPRTSANVPESALRFQ